MAKLSNSAAKEERRPTGRIFFETALAERSAAALAENFRAAAAGEGVRRHFCTRHGEDGTLEILSCDYPFDPEGIAELGRLHFMFDDGAGSRVSVTVAGLPSRIEAGRRARLHGLAMLYATCLPPLLDAGEPGDGNADLTEWERSMLMRLLLGDSELDISMATGVPIRSLARRISTACAKLGADGPRSGIVVAAQRGLLKPHN